MNLKLTGIKSCNVPCVIAGSKQNRWRMGIREFDNEKQTQREKKMKTKKKVVRNLKWD